MGDRNSSNAVMFFSAVIFLAGVVLNTNTQKSFKDGMTASEEVREAEAVWICLDVLDTREIAYWPVTGGTST